MTPDKSDVLYGTLGLMVIKTLEALGPLHGYRIARRPGTGSSSREIDM
jgi:PadR family transcriptional regulator PadR